MRQFNNKTTSAIIFSGFILLVVTVSSFFPERSLMYVGPSAIWDAFYTLVIAGLLMVIAFGIGKKALRYCDVNQLNRMDRGVFSITMGLGILSYGVLFIGLLGWLNYESIVFYS